MPFLYTRFCNFLGPKAAETREGSVNLRSAKPSEVPLRHELGSAKPSEAPLGTNWCRCKKLQSRGYSSSSDVDGYTAITRI